MLALNNLAVNTLLGAGLLGAIPAFANWSSNSMNAISANLRPYCQSAWGGDVVLSFQNDRIYAPQGAERIPLKQLASGACQLDARALDSVTRVVVRGFSYIPQSTLWLDGDSVTSYSQYLYGNSYGGSQPGSRSAQVAFDLNGYTSGRLQLLVQGDVALSEIRVTTQGMQPPPPPPPPSSTANPYRFDSFMQTCSNVQVTDQALDAQCRNRRGDYQFTRLERPWECKEDIKNVDGFLICTREPDRVPQGSFRSSCKNESVSMGTLFASCLTRDGRTRRNTSLEMYRRCRSDIANDNGTLRCR